MCLGVNKKGVFKAKKAKSDIPVYKVLVRNENGKFFSPFMRTPVNVSEDEKTITIESNSFTGRLDVNGVNNFESFKLTWNSSGEIPSVNDVSYFGRPRKRGVMKNGVMRIEGGIHTYKENPQKKFGLSELLFFGTGGRGGSSAVMGPVIFKGIIPKGSYYYEGCNEDCVSTKIELSMDSAVSVWDRFVKMDRNENT